MKIFTKKISWMSASFAYIMLAGAPAIADDTELLLLNPDPNANPTPNVMFILDTSGSMNDPANTTEPYDSTRVYDTGDCDPDRFYWTTLDAEPSCAGGSTAPCGL